MTQAQALDILKTGANVFLTGEPGAGKTHTINAYIAHLRSHGIEPAVTASTGIAATHVGGYTIHSWSGIGIKDSLTVYDLDRIAATEYLVKRVARPHVLIIDEVSMLDGKTLSMVDAVCKEIRGNKNPFGGLQVIFVGDFFQLPPVARQGTRAQFAFESSVWNELSPLVCYLSEQHRQDDLAFLSVLSAIRKGCFEEEHAELLQERMSQEAHPKEIARLFPHNADVDRLNDRELGILSGDKKQFDMTGDGSAGLLASLKKGCLSPERLVLKRGAAVMFTKNNPQAGYVNGTLGTVDSFAIGTDYPMIRTRSGALIEAKPAEWRVDENGKTRAKISQIPLRLAWALTVHKSQGVSLDAAVMDLSGAFEYGQGYVALSRVRRLSGLYLLGWNNRALMVHPDVLAKDTLFRKSSDEAGAAFEAMEKGEVARMHENFIQASGGKKVPAKKQKSDKKGSETNEGGKKGTGKLEEIRKKYPNAYRPWTSDDDARLKDEFGKSQVITILGKSFGRQSGSIRARLILLGLIEPEVGDLRFVKKPKKE